MSYTPPTVADFKSRFDRDFPFCAPEAQTNLDAVRDKDVTVAFTQASANFNEGLFASQATFAEAFLLLSAHFLCQNMLAASQGLGGSANWLTISKGAGALSESFEVPEKIKKDPFLSALSKTVYGSLYLQQILPLLVGNVVALFRRAQPQ